MGGGRMSAIQFSLVTPTFNRAPILVRMLRHLRTVTGIEGCEVIVINDGSTDDTADVLKHFQNLMPKQLRMLTLSNGGPARARNAGVAAAKHERILFIDDDVFPRQDMLQQHWRMLEAGYDGSQGLLVWHEEIAMTPLIRYIDSRGSQFAFDQVDSDEDLGGQYIYTGNFAVRKDVVLRAGGFCEALFDPTLAFSAFEDTVLGHSIRQLGVHLGLNRAAVADHLHHMNEQGYLRREFKVGSGAAKLEQLYPELCQGLGLKPRGRLIGLQAKIAGFAGELPVIERVIGYEGRMRLRHRASFLEGYLHYEKRHTRTKERTAA
jgi:glycosyltransferase involved in cell wall biosynthesis